MFLELWQLLIYLLYLGRGFRDPNKNCSEQRYYLLIVCLAAAKDGEQRQRAGQSKRSSGRGCSKNLGVGGAILANHQEGKWCSTNTVYSKDGGLLAPAEDTVRQ